jgi:hypothetical protein
VRDRLRSAAPRRAASLIAAGLVALCAGGAAAVATAATQPTASVAATTSATATASGGTVLIGKAHTVATTTATATVTATTTATTTPAKKIKPTLPLTGWLASSTIFPDRALVLVPPAQHALSAAGLHVAENGTAVGSRTVTPVADAHPGDAGVVVAIDQSKAISASGISDEIAGVRALAAVRPAGEKLGLVGFDSTGSSHMNPTTDVATINSTLAGTPSTGPGLNPPAGISEAMKQLTVAKVALRAVIVISDGVGLKLSAKGPSPAAVKSQTQATNTIVITVGLADAGSTPASLRALAAAAPGQFVRVTPTGLAAFMVAIQTQLNADAVVRYRSHAAAGKTVSVLVSADGIPGTVQTDYQTLKARTPARTAPAPTTPAHHPMSVRHASGLSFAGSTLLSPTPSFASAPPPPAPAVNHTFWASSSAVAVIAGICALLIALGLALALHRPSKQAVRARVGTFVPLAEDESGLGGPASLRRDCSPVCSE